MCRGCSVFQGTYYGGASNPGIWKSPDGYSCDGFGLWPPPAYPSLPGGLPSVHKSLHADAPQKIGLQVSTGLIRFVPLWHRALLPLPRSSSSAAPVISQHKQGWDEVQTPLAPGGVRCFSPPLSHVIFHWRLFQLEGEQAGRSRGLGVPESCLAVPWCPPGHPPQCHSTSGPSSSSLGGKTMKKILQTEDNLFDEFPEIFLKESKKKKTNRRTKRKSPRKTWGFTSLEIKRILEWKTFA